MRAERFGSYSIAITSAATPCFRRLKSTMRYLLLVSAADVPDGDATVVVAAAGPLLGLDVSVFSGFDLGDLGKSGKRLEANRGRKWTKSLECHDSV